MFTCICLCNLQLKAPFCGLHEEECAVKSEMMIPWGWECWNLGHYMGHQVKNPNSKLPKTHSTSGRSLSKKVWSKVKKKKNWLSNQDEKQVDGDGSKASCFFLLCNLKIVFLSFCAFTTNSLQYLFFLLDLILYFAFYLTLPCKQTG